MKYRSREKKKTLDFSDTGAFYIRENNVTANYNSVSICCPYSKTFQKAAYTSSF